MKYADTQSAAIDQFIAKQRSTIKRVRRLSNELSVYSAPEFERAWVELDNIVSKMSDDLFILERETE